ncbi:hypothetical protein BA896_007485 [Janthinobacterium lividum]|uniref:Uncharacterized protein n=1 Tax=Janthinobacterium lividum TaxID=29581 RepID=A0A1E8PRX2_9BURK|nr:hypothetical protein BA896_007485 [Janthinobacterium lividum]
MLKLKLVVATLLVASTTVALAAVPTPKVCHDGFKLKGNTDTAWKDVTLNAWNGKMLPALWTDKGGHFLSQVKKRGNDVAIQTPGDLESFLRGTTAVLDPKTDAITWARTKVENQYKSFSILMPRAKM